LRRNVYRPAILARAASVASIAASKPFCGGGEHAVENKFRLTRTDNGDGRSAKRLTRLPSSAETCVRTATKIVFLRWNDGLLFTRVLSHRLIHLPGWSIASKQVVGPRRKGLFSRLEAFMKATIDELNCEGTILIDKIERGFVTCWLTKEQTGVEGTIVGDEAMMIEIQAAGKASLRLHDGSILPIRSCGGSDGIRWVKVLSAR
jgi:hypothetical protein